jgi:L-lactate dehydrogenase complex protein LldG
VEGKAKVSDRDRMLAQIRRSLGVSGGEASRKAAVADRLERHPRNLVPMRGEGDRVRRIALFSEMAKAVSASLESVPSLTDIPVAVQTYLRAHNLPPRLRHGLHALIENLPWDERAPSIERMQGRALLSDEISLSHAFAGVAETGTLVLLSGPDNPTSLNFLPETHIVLVFADDIAGNYEDVWDRLRQRSGTDLPRTVNMITGPSRTGDIEQTIELGAHGPRRLHIILIEGTPGAPHD